MKSFKYKNSLQNYIVYKIKLFINIDYTKKELKKILFKRYIHYDGKTGG